eukprot:2148447-Prymnesium_polylepis.2
MRRGRQRTRARRAPSQGRARHQRGLPAAGGAVPRGQSAARAKGVAVRVVSGGAEAARCKVMTAVRGLGGNVPPATSPCSRSHSVRARCFHGGSSRSAAYRRGQEHASATRLSS